MIEQRGRALRGSPGFIPALAMTVAAAWVVSCENPQPPLLCGAIPQQTVFTGETTRVKACFDDPNGDLLVYSTVTSDPGVATAVAAGNTVTVEGVAPGSASVTVTATDVGGLQAEVRFQVVVPNRAPLAVGVISSLELAVGDSAVVDVAGQFSDPDGQGLSYAVTLSDTSVARVSGAGSVFTVTAWAKGMANVTVTATDPGGLEAVQSFAVTVPNRPPEPVGSMPARTVEVGETVTHELASYFRDPDGDPLVYTAAASDATVAGVSVSGDTVAVAALAKGGTTVSITATDPEGLAATQEFIVTVPNRAPLAIGTAPADTVSVGETSTLDPSAYFRDPDGDSLAYTATASDAEVAGVSVSAGAVTVTAVAKGEATVTIMATDTEGLTASQAFTVTVPNRAPSTVGVVLADTVAVGETATLDLSAYFSDPDGDPLVYTATASNTAVLGVAASDGALTVTAIAKGEATVTVTASDTEGLTATQAFNVTVPNRAPEPVGSMPAQTVEVGDTVTHELPSYFRDSDGDPLVFAATAADARVAGVSVAIDTVAVAALAKGGTTVSITATDPEGLAATQEFIVTVPNRAPLAIGTAPADTVSVGETSTLDPSAYFRDPDGDSLAYTATASDAEVAGVSVSAGAVTVTAVAKGEATVTIMATDTEGLTASQAFTVTVPNRAPSTVGVVLADTVAVGETATLDLSAYFSDPDGDPLVYTATASNTAVLGVAASDGALTVTAIAKGEATVTVTASDTEGLTATQAFNVTVPNRAPEPVGSMPAQTVEVGDTVTHELPSYFRDSDGDPLVFAATAADARVAGVSVAIDTVAVAALAKGGTTVSITATDPEGLAATQEFIVTVPNRAPLAIGTAPADTVSVGETSTLDPSAYFRDPDGDSLAYTATASDAEVAGVSVSAGAVTVTAVAKGEATVTIMATDTEGLTASQAFTVTVPNRAPSTVGVVLADTVAVGETATLDLSAYFSDPDGDPLVYTATASNTAVLGVAASDGALTVTAIAKGEATVTVTASDTEGLTATQAFNVTVPNRAPVAGDPIQPRILSGGGVATLELSAHFSDPDGDSLDFAAVTSNSTVARVEVSDAELTVTAIARGEAAVTVTASDGDGLAATQAFAVAVSNQAPLATGAFEAWTLTAGETGTLELSPHFGDPDGDALTFAAVVSDTAVVAVSLSGATLTIAATAKGVATVTITATDTDGLSAAQAFTVTVPNRTPLAVGTFKALRLSSGGVARVDPAPGFADADGDSLIFDATSSDLDVARAWVSLGQVLVRAVGRGTATITVTGRDPEGLSATQGFDVEVRASRETDPNHPPVTVGALVDQTLEVGDTRTLNVASYFSDVDGDDLAFAAESSDISVAGATARGSKVELRAVALGTTSVTITARDPDGLTASLGFTATVSEATQANRAPVVVGFVEAQPLKEGDSLSLKPAEYFLDPDGDALAFAAASSNVGVATVAESGNAVVVRAVVEGRATITVTAGDTEGLTASLGFAVMVGDSTSSGFVPCRGGSAGSFPCSGVDLVSRLTREQMGAAQGTVNDVWGWTDPATGTEWALVGHSSGTAFVSLADPERPVYVGVLPMTSGARASLWRDIKVYGDHAFIVADRAGAHGMQVFDLTQLRGVQTLPHTFSATALYTGIGSAHNIVINEATGFAYSVGGRNHATCGSGLHIIDIRTPSAPAYAGCFNDSSTGRSGTGYTHDAMCVVYNGPDTDHQGKEVCFGANETRLSIADVSDKSNPVALASASYPDVVYSHQGWLDEAHKYFYMNDELDEIGGLSSTRTLVWDVKDLDDPVVATQFLHSTTATDHNLYVVGDLMYQSNYNAGLRILSIASRENPVETAYFDTEPGGSGLSLDGSWSNYPFFASGVIPVTSIEGGVFFVRLSN